MKRKSFLSLILLVITTSMLLTACGEKAPGNQSSSSASVANGKDGNVLNVTLGGASPGGFWSLIGEGIGNIMRKSIPGSQFSYETGNGVSNTINTASGKLTMGLAHNFEIKAGLEGMEPYKEKMPKVTAIATMYNNAAQQFIMTKEFADKYGIKGLEDIKKKKPPIKVAVNQRGNLTEAINRISFEANGFTYKDIKKWGGEVYYEPYKPAADMMKDNKVDLFGVPVFAPDGKILELLTSKELVILPINEEAQKELEKELGIPAGVIPANSYEFQKEDIATSYASCIITVDPNMSEDEAYTITKTLVENIKKIQALHKNLEVLTPEIMSDVEPAMLHPGAEKYYKEAGILK
ncbi:TAXI family TRAP transporter solute-binding subunit [Fictibacillus enclensis]|uniref:TAXI family TRAP transporter solute-binding subunit n=1 Tax=Fictibacillus enclensis TaxID=1017270 RepID=UPI0025A1F357|nr:TAXI family TRAP transporter solute-binding subunit [Fictibacillus enclensis]MDM5196695.1 TAXI family TRAP transporter solute-binding subunit [Fictibacillus enclensis]